MATDAPLRTPEQLGYRLAAVPFQPLTLLRDASRGVYKDHAGSFRAQGTCYGSADSRTCASDNRNFPFQLQACLLGATLFSASKKIQQPQAAAYTSKLYYVVLLGFFLCIGARLCVPNAWPTYSPRSLTAQRSSPHAAVEGCMITFRKGWVKAILWQRRAAGPCL